jgi:uncharacterized membrane protein YhaH (DUF805 family)
VSNLPTTVFPKRLSRLPYLLRIVIIYVLFWVLGQWKRSLALPLTDAQLWEFISGCVCVALYSTVFVIVPRLRDSGLEWWYVVLSFVPLLSWVVLIILAIQPSRAEVVAKPPDPLLEPPAGRHVESL